MSDYLVVFSSSTGFTERYAKWISEELECEAVKLNDLDSSQMKSAKTLIYGGPIHAGWVAGLKRFLRRPERQKGQNVIVFGVGLATVNSADAKRYHTANLKEGDRNLPWFYFQGGVDIEKVRWPVNTILKKIVLADFDNQRKVAKEAGKALEDIDNPLKQDHSDRTAIKPLVETAKALG